MEKKLIAAKKARYTREIKDTKNYFQEMVLQVITQKPQPNGRIYLHGEPITSTRLSVIANSLKRLITVRNLLNNNK